jgi:serine/threonine-protein kinase
MSGILERLQQALADRYRVEHELGAGGMAMVYHARDLRHDRNVALKVLRPELSAVIGAERFLHEIKTTANLQHPHILPLHDSGEADGVVYYVMPLVEGESLRDRLAREHQLPVDDAVRIAREVADALDYAHRHGVIHRDIKPENILLHDGRVQVADFGIALAVSSAGGSTRLTETGMSLGTPSYMSPEQAMGEREVTVRSDVYALGCVLYEMLAGEPPFTGPTAQAIVARVVTETPRSLTIQRHTIPPHVEAAVGKALEKLPADRFATAAEFAEALAHPEWMTAQATVAARSVAKPDWRTRLFYPVAAIALLAAGVAGRGLLQREPAPPVSRYGLALPSQQAPLMEMPFEISPDGSRLVYVGPMADGPFQLWVKSRDRHEATPVTGTSGVYNFTLSPDGEWLAFVQEGSLKKVPVVGGGAITLADSVSGTPGLAWLDDGTIVYIVTGSRELRRIPDVGGVWTRVWQSDSAAVRYPAPIPGSRGVLFTRCRGAGCTLEQDLWVADLRSAGATRLVAGAARSRYAPRDRVVYVRRDGGMFAIGFDSEALTSNGSPVPVLDSVMVINEIEPLFALSPTGVMIVRRGEPMSSRIRYEMVWVTRSGEETPVDPAWRFQMPLFGANSGWALSPDGSRVAIGLATEAGDDIWVKQLPRGPLSRVSFDSASDFRPRWRADGQTITFVSNRGGTAALYERNADGTGADHPALAVPAGLFEGVWSPDGRWLLVRTGGTVNQIGGRDIWALRPGVDTAPAALMTTSFDEAAIALSPDGHWLAHESNETGRVEVYVRPFPAVESGKWQVSIAGGAAPLWARSGRELFYVNAGRELVVVPVAPGAPLRLGEQRALFRLRDDLYLAERENYTPFDVSRDGSRFLMARLIRPESERSSPLIVTENWFTELDARMGRR